MARNLVSPGQIPLLEMGSMFQSGQSMSWENRQKLCKPKNGRNKKGADNNFHNQDYDFESPTGEIFTGKGIRLFASKHNLNESCLRDLLKGRLHSYKGWKKAVGGKKQTVAPIYYFLSPNEKIYETNNLSEFARSHSLCPIALSRISRCLLGTHKGWRHCDPRGLAILPPDRKHRSFKLRSPNGDIVNGSNLSKFAITHGLSRTCLALVLDGLTKEHRGWTKP